MWRAHCRLVGWVSAHYFPNVATAAQIKLTLTHVGDFRQVVAHLFLELFFIDENLWRHMRFVLLVGLIAALGVLVSAYGSAEDSPVFGNVTNAPAEMEVESFRVKPEEYVVAFTTVKGIAIARLALQGLDDLGYDKQSLCEETAKLLSAAVKGNGLTVYGCDQEVPAAEIENTLFLDVVLSRMNRLYYSGQVQEQRTDIQINTYRLEPRRSIAPRFQYVASFPTSDEKEWLLFKQSFPELFSHQIREIGRALKNREE